MGSARGLAANDRIADDSNAVKVVHMDIGKIVSSFSAGAFVAFTLVSYNVVSDAGKGAFYAFGLIALIWIVRLSDKRRSESEADGRIKKPEGS